MIAFGGGSNTREVVFTLKLQSDPGNAAVASRFAQQVQQANAGNGGRSGPSGVTGANGHGQAGNDGAVKSFRDKLRYNDMLRREEEKQEREQTARLNRMRVANEKYYGDLYKRANSAASGILGLTRSIVLMGASSEQSMVKAVKALAAFEAGVGAARSIGSIGKAIGAGGAFRGVMAGGGLVGAGGGALAVGGAGAAALAGVGLGGLSIYESATGRMGANSWTNMIGRMPGDAIAGALGYGPEDNAKTQGMLAMRSERAAMQSRQAQAAQHNMGVSQMLARRRFGVAQSGLDFRLGQHGFAVNSMMSQALGSGDLGGIASGQWGIIANAEARATLSQTRNGFAFGQERQRNAFAMNAARNELHSARGSDDTQRISQAQAAYNAEVMKSIDLKNRERESYVAVRQSVVETMEAQRQARLGEAASIRAGGQDAAARFGQLSPMAQARAARAQGKLAIGQPLTNSERAELEGLGITGINSRLREGDIAKGKRAGFDRIFGQGIEAEARSRENLARDIGVKIELEQKEIKFQIETGNLDAMISKISDGVARLYNDKFSELADKLAASVMGKIRMGEVAKNAQR